MQVVMVPRRKFHEIFSLVMLSSSRRKKRSWNWSKTWFEMKVEQKQDKMKEAAECE
jgi:hypothetical protein